MKEFEKLLFEEVKRTESEKANLEVKLGLFEQKEESTFDFTAYTKITYGKKLKGLYDLYRNNETNELVFVCPLVENNKGDVDERLDMEPYAYDVLYLEYLNNEDYEAVKKASVHEKGGLVNTFYILSFVAYFVLLGLILATVISLLITGFVFTSFCLVCGPIIGAFAVYTGLMPVIIMNYRKYKIQ